MITITRDRFDGHFMVWTDCFEGALDGRCIGSGKTTLQALERAHRELGAEQRRVAKLRASEVRKRLKRK